MAMEKKYLIVNIGSASKKYSLFNYKCIFNANFEKIGKEFLLTTESNKKETKKINKNDYENSADYLLKILVQKNLIDEGLYGIGIRIVAPGLYFLENKIIDDNYIKKLNEASSSAPLHIKPTLIELINLKKILPKVKIVGISDSEFHKTKDEISKLYAINNEIAKKLELYKYGYHGISVKSILNKLKSSFEEIPKKIIICHLGGGSSVIAIKDQKSFDTSMGYTPLEGIFSTTRIGDIDSGAVIYLGKKLKLNYEKLEEYLNKECGLYGLGGSADVRELLKNKKTLALDTFCYRIKKYIGSYISAMNGLDLIIFTGAIGYNSTIIRAKILNNLDNLGIILDEKKNEKNLEGYIENNNSKVKILVMKTDEMNEMFNGTKKILNIF